jgi:hypothetical protein
LTDNQKLVVLLSSILCIYMQNRRKFCRGSAAVQELWVMLQGCMGAALIWL